MRIKDIAEKYYYQFGMNVNAICGDTVVQRNPYKAPADANWEEFLDKRIPSASFDGQKWDDATGVGLILGYNDYRAIDIDNLYEDDDCPQSMNDVGRFPSPDPRVKEMLAILGLPEDYEWVVYSGSNRGLHIIFRVQDIPNEEISFRSKAYDDSHGTTFEFRWRDYLVLPPSIHSSRSEYRFRYESTILPPSAPQYIPLDNVFRFLNCYCGRTDTTSLRLDGHEDWLFSFELQRTIRTLSGDWSGSTPPSSDREEFQLYSHCTSPDALNYIGVEYCIGRFVKASFDKAYLYFTQSHTEDSHVNIAELISHGLVEGTKEEMSWHAERGIAASKTYCFEAAYNKCVLKAGSKRYLFFDTETNGLPEDFNTPPSEFENWPRLIELAWVITDEHGQVLSKNDFIIYPEGFAIRNDVAKLTGITTQKAKEDGSPYRSVLSRFSDDLEDANVIIGHNINYDIAVLEAESARSLYDGYVGIDFDHVKKCCTMEMGTNVCKIPSIRGYKYPKLEELYYTLFNREFTGAHNALSDALATVECYFELLEKDKGSFSSNDIVEKEIDSLPF